MDGFDFRQLESFCRVADLKSFSKAAESLFLTQPTISGHISALERSLGMVLLDRLGREVEMTSSGKVLYRHASALLALRRETLDELSELSGALKGDLFIGGSNIPGEYILPPMIGRFKALDHRISIFLKIGDTREVLDRLLRGEIELAVVGARMDAFPLAFERYAQDEIILVASPVNPIAQKGHVSIHEVAAAPMVLREKGSGTRLMVEKRISESGLSLESFHIIGELGSTSAVKESIKADLGISFVSKVAVKDELRFQLLKEVRIDGLEIRRDFFTARDTRRILSPPAKKFLKFIWDERQDLEGDTLGSRTHEDIP